MFDVSELSSFNQLSDSTQLKSGVELNYFIRLYSVIFIFKLIDSWYKWQ